MPDDLATRFRAVHEAGAEAFNAGDLERALGGLPEEFEWHPYDVDPEESVIRGPDAVIAYFQRYRDVFESWRTDPRTYEELGDSAVLVHHVITGRSRGAGVPVTIDVFEVWEFENDLPRRVWQYGSREEAIAARG